MLQTHTKSNQIATRSVTILYYYIYYVHVFKSSRVRNAVVSFRIVYISTSYLKNSVADMEEWLRTLTEQNTNKAIISLTIILVLF